MSEAWIGELDDIVEIAAEQGITVDELEDLLADYEKDQRECEE